MSITIFMKTPTKEKHDVEVAGRDKVADLYEKAAAAADVVEGTFVLRWEATPLDHDNNKEVQHLGLVDGCEVEMLPSNTMVVAADEVEKRCKAIAKRLKSSRDMVLVVDASAGVKDGVLEVRSDILPKALKHIRFVDPESCVTTIGSFFLTLFDDALQAPALTTVDLSLLKSVTSIEGGFLDGLQYVETVRLPPMDGTDTVRERFLNGCRSLRQVDLSPLRGARTVESFFLGSCRSLKSVDLSPLDGVLRIGNSFLYECGLTEVDLSPLHGTTTIGSSFLRSCGGLKSLDLSPLSNVTRVDYNFLLNCSLESVSLLPLRYAHINRQFILGGCPAKEAAIKALDEASDDSDDAEDTDES